MPWPLPWTQRPTLWVATPYLGQAVDGLPASAAVLEVQSDGYLRPPTEASYIPVHINVSFENTVVSSGTHAVDDRRRVEQ